jgi:putative chitinase
MQIEAIQRKLGVPADGSLGPTTYAALFSHVAGRSGATFEAFGRAAAAHFPAYGIATDLRLIHWCGQVAHESAGFFYLKELGDPSYFFNMYDKDGKRPKVAAQLGNIQAGDGARYCGRGLIQLTGRANYRSAGARLGLPLETNPDLASDPANAVLIACDYWKSRAINALADRNDIQAVTRAINGGLNGLSDRQKYTERARAIIL